MENAADRRHFLKFLAASPLFALGLPGWGRALAEANAPEGAATRDVIASPNDALNVLDFEPIARQTLPPAHYGYLATGVDDDATLRANRTGFSRFQIRTRRLVDVSRIDTSTELFGTTWKTPIVLAPVGSQKAFHPDGEVASARAAGARGHSSFSRPPARRRSRRSHPPEEGRSGISSIPRTRGESRKRS
jgi:hypothetical protein